MNEHPEAVTVDTGHDRWTSLDQMHVFANVLREGLQRLKAGDRDDASLTPRMAGLYAENMAHYYHAHLREQQVKDMADEMLGWARSFR
jgi:hypothetical protein